MSAGDAVEQQERPEVSGRQHRGLSIRHGEDCTALGIPLPDEMPRQIKLLLRENERVWFSARTKLQGHTRAGRKPHVQPRQNVSTDPGMGTEKRRLRAKGRSAADGGGYPEERKLQDRLLDRYRPEPIVQTW